MKSERQQYVPYRKRRKKYEIRIKQGKDPWFPWEKVVEVKAERREAII
jgi:hypothetical protein